MIWGDVINEVRKLHVELLDHAQVPLQSFRADHELSGDDFPFPNTGDDYGDWQSITLPDHAQEAIEFHPVERVLVEGPLLPIQEVILRAEDWPVLQEAVIRLEKEWLSKANLATPERITFVEDSLRAQFIKLRTRSGGFRLQAL